MESEVFNKCSGPLIKGLVEGKKRGESVFNNMHELKETSGAARRAFWLMARGERNSCTY